MGAGAGHSLWQVLLMALAAFRIQGLPSENLQCFPSIPRVKPKPPKYTDPTPGNASVESI